MYVIETRRGTLVARSKSLAGATIEAQGVAINFAEVVMLRQGQRPLFRVDANGRVPARKELLLDLQRVRVAMSEVASRARQQGHADIADACFAAEVQFENLEVIK